MARCGWCLVGDHEHHLPGGTGWSCDCPASHPETPRFAIRGTSGNVSPTELEQPTHNTRRIIMAARKAAEEKTEKAAAEVKDTNWLAGVIADKTGKEYTTYQLRILLRKLTKDGVIERGEGRYTFKGVNDPTVKAIIKAVKDGAMETETKERTTKAKTAKTTKKAAAGPSRKRKPKAEPEPEEEDDDLDDIDEI